MIRSKPVAIALAVGAAGAVVAIGLGAFSARAESYRDPSVDISAVGDLDLDRYLGKWYEIARFPNRFEEGCVGVTAEYGLREDGRISVTNTCRKTTLDGPVEQAEGEARIVAPGQLEVLFAPQYLSFLPFVWGDYWVLDVTDDYSVSVVGTPKGSTGWILARTPQLSDAEYERALAVLRENGYDTGAIERVLQADGGS